MKKNLAVIFGGRSSEHEVSCVSVVTIAKAVDLENNTMEVMRRDTLEKENGKIFGP